MKIRTKQRRSTRRKSNQTCSRKDPGEWLSTAYDKMNSHFGDLHWWPAETPFEMAVGSILTQNTAWRNVERAVGRLRAAGLLDADRFQGADLAEISDAIRPAGFYNLKARRLRAFVNYLHGRYGGRMEIMFQNETAQLRTELLAVSGIGEETADSILLYGDNRPLFVVDTYTRRICDRHGLIDASSTYGDVQRFFMDHISCDASLYNQFHALIVNTGKHFCKKTPVCDGCPLESIDGDVSRETYPNQGPVIQ